MEDVLQSFTGLASVAAKSIVNDATHTLTHLIKQHTVAGDDVDHVIITVFPFDLSDYAPGILLEEAMDYLQHYPQYFLFNLHLKWRFIQILYQRFADVVFYQDPSSFLHPIIQIAVNILGSNYLAYFLSVGFFLLVTYCVLLTAGTDYSHYVISTEIPEPSKVPATTSSKVNTIPAKPSTKFADDPLPPTQQPAASTSAKLNNNDTSNKPPTAPSNKLLPSTPSEANSTPLKRYPSMRQYMVPSSTPKTQMTRMTPNTGMSSLTPDSGFKEISWRMDLTEDRDGDSGSEGSNGISDTSLPSMYSMGDEIDPDDHPVIQKSVSDPSILIGWRIFIEGYGPGTILSIKPKKFSTTKYVVQFDNGQIHALALKRSKRKGKVPFQLIKRVT